VSEPPELRISDADRERALQHLQNAVSEGRLTMSEFDERVAGVLRARTGSDLRPYLADLPASRAAPEQGQLRATMSTIKRTGEWVVPRRLSVTNKAGSVKLDLTDAVIGHPVIEIAIEVYAGSTTLVLPRGASVDIEQVELVASSGKVKKVPTSTEPIGEPHVVVTGKQWAGSVTVRHQRRFLHWRW
jgi:Domain of unknown function (DUF1707)